MSVASLPEWVTAGVGSVAAATAAVTFWRNERTRTQQQARLVYASVEPIRVHHEGDAVAADPTTDDVHWAFDTFPDPAALALRPPELRATRPCVAARVTLHNLSDELIAPWCVVLRDRTVEDIDTASYVTGVGEPNATTLRVYVFPIDEDMRKMSRLMRHVSLRGLYEGLL